MHSFFLDYISNSHSHSHFYIRGHQLLLLLLLSPHNPFTFKLRPDAAVATSRRVWRYVVTQPSLRRDAVSDASGGSKKHRKSRLQSRETHFQIRQISFYRIWDC